MLATHSNVQQLLEGGGFIPLQEAIFAEVCREVANFGNKSAKGKGEMTVTYKAVRVDDTRQLILSVTLKYSRPSKGRGKRSGDETFDIRLYVWMNGEVHTMPDPAEQGDAFSNEKNVQSIKKAQ